MTNDTTEEAVVEFTWNEAEYLRLTRKYGVLRRITQVYAVLAVVTVGCGVVVTVASGNGAAWFCYSVGGFCVLMLLCLRPLTRRTWRRVPGLQGPHRLVFSGDGVQTNTELGDSSVRWKVFKHLRERNDCYLLSRQQKMVSTIVPKRGFRSPHDEAVFRMLVRSHVEDCRLAKSALDEPPAHD